MDRGILSQPIPGLSWSVLSLFMIAIVPQPYLRGDDDGTGDIPPAWQRSKNFELPADLPADKATVVQEGVAAFESFREAEADTDALLKKAIAQLDKARLAVPRSAVPLFFLGQAYQFKKSFSRAKSVLEKAVRLNPEFHEAWVELGDVHVHLKKPSDAIEHYDRALELAPEHPAAAERKAFALVRLGEFEEASPLLEKVQQKWPAEGRKLVLRRLETEIRGPGWDDTYKSESRNYTVLTPVSQEFADHVSRHAELILRTYKEVFADVKRPKRKYAIWVYPDRDSYVRAGAPPQTGGYYDRLIRKLVLFKGKKEDDLLNVLYHEAFHQFLDDYLEVVPQWFNEGLGDYYGAFRYERQGSKHTMRSRPNSWRLRHIQAALRSKACPPVRDLMVMTQREMYRSSRAGIHYAQAWSLIYFIFQGGKEYAYDKALYAYFRALRRGRDIEEAYEATFGRLDMDEFERRWRNFTLQIRE